MKNKVHILTSIFLLLIFLTGCSEPPHTKESTDQNESIITAEIAAGVPAKESQYKVVTDFANTFYTFDYHYDKQAYLSKNKLLVTETLFTFVQQHISLIYMEERTSVLTSLKIEGYEETSPTNAKVFVEMYYKATSTFGFPLEEVEADQLRGYIEIIKDNDTWLVDNMDIKNLSS